MRLALCLRRQAAIKRLLLLQLACAAPAWCSTDPACKQWWPKKSGGSSCQKVENKYCLQCCE